MDNFSLSDIAAVTRGVDNDGHFGGNGAWWIIILFLFVFMGGGFGFNRHGEFGQFATAASQQEILFGQQFGQLNDRLTSIGNGICSLGYDMQGNICNLGKEMALAQNGTNMTIMQTGNSIQAQLANCCCENRLATANLAAQMDRQTCDITTAIHTEGDASQNCFITVPSSSFTIFCATYKSAVVDAPIVTIGSENTIQTSVSQIASHTLPRYFHTGLSMLNKFPKFIRTLPSFSMPPDTTILLSGISSAWIPPISDRKNGN